MKTIFGFSLLKNKKKKQKSQVSLCFWFFLKKISGLIKLIFAVFSNFIAILLNTIDRGKQTNQSGKHFQSINPDLIQQKKLILPVIFSLNRTALIK